MVARSRHVVVLALGTNVGEDIQSGLGCENINVNLVKIVYVNLYLCHFSLSKTSVLSEDSSVLLISVDISLRMHELASLAISTEVLLMELVASFSHELLGHVGLLH